MKNIITLIDAICDAYDNQSFVPSDGTTHCNEAVSYVAATMGYQDLIGKTADQIISFLSKDENWSIVDMSKAQEMANQGSLLIAGLNSEELNQSHGHVVIIRPGKPCYSGKWGPCPRVLNIGSENFISRAKKGPLTNQPSGLNESFIDPPKIWIWRGSL